MAQVINKANDGFFSTHDERLFEKYLQFCGIGLRNAQIYERSQLEVKRNQVLLDLAGVIFQEQVKIQIERPMFGNYRELGGYMLNTIWF